MIRFHLLKHHFIILAIFLFSLLVRLYNIFNIGIFHWDSGYFVNTALWLSGNGGLPTPWDPPFYSLIVSFLFIIIGVYDWIPIVVSGVFGSLTILITYLISKQFFSIRTSLVAALFLSINYLHIIYSRTALLDSTFTFFFSLSILLFISGFKSKKIIHFIFFGIALGITQNIKYYGFLAFFIALSFLFFYYLFKKYHNTKVDFFYLSKGMIIAFLLLVTLHLPWIFSLGLGSYLIEDPSLEVNDLLSVRKLDIISCFSKGISIYFNIFTETKNLNNYISNDLLYYPYLLIFWTTPVIIIFFILFFTWKIDRYQLFLLIWFLFFLLFFTIWYNAPRVILPILPAFSIMCARGLDKFTFLIKSTRFKIIKEKYLTIIICFVILLLSSPYVLEASTNVHNGYKLAGSYLKNNVSSNQYIFSFSGPQIRFYYPNASWWKFCQNKSASVIEYVLVDYMKYSYNENQILDIEKLENNSELITEINNEIVDIIVLAQIGNINVSKEELQKIRIYKLNSKGKEHVRFLDEIKDNVCVDI